MKKILISAFLQETNSFSPVITQSQDFSDWAGANSNGTSETDGMADVLREGGYEIAFGPLLRAQASGPMEHKVVDSYLSSLFEAIADAGDLEAVCLSMHGATQSTQCDDVCGMVAAAVRRLLGSQKALAISVDLHANITPLLYENVDCICGYQTYPHRDLYETGARAARLCCRKLAGETFYSARVVVPMIVPASGYTTNGGAFGALVEQARLLVENGRLLDYSIFQMQPWLDTAQGGSCVLAVAYDSRNAQECAVELAQKLAQVSEEMQPHTESPDEIIDEGFQNRNGGPIIVSDFSDSPNAGASGDNVLFLERLIARNVDFKAAVIVNDPAAVTKAFATGVGHSAQFQLGGTLDRLRSHSIKVHARVRSLHDGSFILGGPVLRGAELSVGLSAVISVGTIDILVCSAMAITGDIQLYRHFGIEPAFYRLVLVKANTSFRAAYNEVSDHFRLCDTKGAATSDLTSLPFKKLPESFYPFSSLQGYCADKHLDVRKN